MLFSRLKEKFSSFSIFIFQLAISLFLFTLFFRIAEFSILGLKTTLPHGVFQNELLGIAGDIAAISYYAVVLFLPLFLLFLLNESASKFLLKIIFIVLIIFQLLLIIYFIISGVLLDDAFYNYSYTDIKYIIESSGISIALVIIGIAFMAIILFYILGRLGKKPRIPFLLKKIFLPLALLITIFHQRIINDAINGDFGLSMQVNKSFYFINRTIRHFGKNQDYIPSKIMADEIPLFQKEHNTKEYVSGEYPLEVKNNFPNVLSPFFNETPTKPNLVFVIVEGLAKCFSGAAAPDGSFTPFLDSLSRQSIYFSNFLSTSERTIGVLPSLLGSLPYGKSGFAKFIEAGKYPRHFSLLKILKANGYYTSFHYGGWVHFSDYDDFLYEQGIDYISQEKEAEDFSWGLSDDSLYRKSFHVLDSIRNPQPRVDVYLTLSTHHPFKVPDQEYYNRKFLSHLETLPIDNARKEEMKKYSVNLASVLFADDALKNFFKEYSSRPEFSNTIFFITGDHAMPEIALRNGYLNCYHVPFIIYSPLLKTNKTIESVSSHLDVTPSLLAFLKENYQLKVPDTVHWLGDGLDTTSTFRNTHSLAFMHNSTEIPDYLSGNYFLNGDKVYDISAGLDNKKELTSPEIISDMKKKLETFRRINQYICSSDKILDARTADWFKAEKEKISLPVKTVFTFSGKDTTMYVLDKFDLENTGKAMMLHYSFNYKLNSTFAAQNPSIVFLLTDKDGNALSKEEQSFNLGSRKAEWNGIPVNGFYSVDLKKMQQNNIRLSIFFKRKTSDTGVINNFRLKANTN